MATKQQTTTTPTTAAPTPPARSGRARGTIQHLYPERSFGFIRCTEGAEGDIGEDFFFHATGLEGLRLHDLLPGTLVEFEATTVPRGKRAEHISALS